MSRWWIFYFALFGALHCGAQKLPDGETKSHYHSSDLTFKFSPTDSSYTVQSQPGFAFLSFYSVVGKKMMTVLINGPVQQVDLRQLPPGFYYAETAGAFVSRVIFIKEK